MVAITWHAPGRCRAIRVAGFRLDLYVFVRIGNCEENLAWFTLIGMGDLRLMFDWEATHVMLDAIWTDRGRQVCLGIESPVCKSPQNQIGVLPGSTKTSG
jgi:hypothetical protein